MLVQLMYFSGVLKYFRGCYCCHYAHDESRKGILECGKVGSRVPLSQISVLAELHVGIVASLAQNMLVVQIDDDLLLVMCLKLMVLRWRSVESGHHFHRNHSQLALLFRMQIDAHGQKQWRCVFEFKQYRQSHL